MATKIFEPFFTSKEHGMGLGLSVCRTILAAHGGTLSTVNNADRGAAFHFTLPAESTSNRESPANG
jgi:signal transduction histidine kinase